ncbi:DMT family transporter [Marinicrinis sediminis]|uniref:DMT family transporter n=1 Tax=Marinicrinis sediminis TaxID=1652465 RepID=A0ABW5R774_9BACL
MNRDWLLIGIAAFFEVCWVIGLKHADQLWAWSGTIVAIVISFYGLIAAGKRLPVGTVYTVFVGLGTAGTVLSEILFFGEPFRWSKVLLVLLLLIGVIGIKSITDEGKPQTGEE